MPKKKHSGTTPGTRVLAKDGPFPRKVVSTDVQGSPPELCSAQYTATIVPVPDAGDEVVIQASGVHPTSGYEVFFQRSPLDIYPPQFSLWHVTPSGPVLDVITPFAKFTGFKLNGQVQEVTILDASGPHKVKVEKLGSRIAMCG